MEKNTKDQKGEGNRQADRNYREGVREIVANTTAQERAKKARNIDSKQLDELKKAEEKGKSPARS